MNLLKIARVPAVTVPPDITVQQAVDEMVGISVGAVIVVENGRLKGIFTERDVIRRVAASWLPMTSTLISEVMTSPVKFVNNQTSSHAALEIMVSNHFRHLPIIDESSHIVGMLSIRHLLRHMVEILSHELASLDAYLGVDGIGGD